MTTNIIILLLLVILAFARENLLYKKRLKAVRKDDSFYNKMYEENIELRLEIIELEMKLKATKAFMNSIQHSKQTQAENSFILVEICPEQFEKMMIQN